MNALSGSVAERARKAWDAGCDIVLHCNGDLPEMTSVAASAHRLSGASADRAQKVDVASRARADVDIAAIEDEYNALTREQAHA